MSAQIGPPTFVTPVDFSITHVVPLTLPPANGTGANGDPATVDPLAAYQFTFGVPTLNHAATLSFDIILADLDPATAAALLAALASGSATLATQGDAPGATYQAFPLCVGSEDPTVDGCVRVQLFDENGEETTGTPASSASATSWGTSRPGPSSSSRLSRPHRLSFAEHGCLCADRSGSTERHHLLSPGASGSRVGQVAGACFPGPRLSAGAGGPVTRRRFLTARAGPDRVPRRTTPESTRRRE